MNLNSKRGALKYWILVIIILTILVAAFAMHLKKVPEPQCDQIIAPIEPYVFCSNHETQCTLNAEQSRKLAKAKQRNPECFKDD